MGFQEKRRCESKFLEASEFSKLVKDGLFDLSFGNVEKESIREGLP